MVLLAMGIGTSQIYLVQKMAVFEEQLDLRKSQNLTEFLAFVDEADKNLGEEISKLESKISARRKTGF